MIVVEIILMVTTSLLRELRPLSISGIEVDGCSNFVKGDARGLAAAPNCLSAGGIFF
jgi:hypothetical protein